MATQAAVESTLWDIKKVFCAAGVYPEDNLHEPQEKNQHENRDDTGGHLACFCRFLVILRR